MYSYSDVCLLDLWYGRKLKYLFAEQNRPVQTYIWYFFFITPPFFFFCYFAILCLILVVFFCFILDQTNWNDNYTLQCQTNFSAVTLILSDFMRGVVVIVGSMVRKYNSNLSSHSQDIFTDILSQVYNPINCQQLYTCQDEDTNKNRLPVTQIRFRPFIDGEKIEYSHILIASCKFVISFSLGENVYDIWTNPGKPEAYQKFKVMGFGANVKMYILVFIFWNFFFFWLKLNLICTLILWTFFICSSNSK